MVFTFVIAVLPTDLCARDCVRVPARRRSHRDTTRVHAARQSFLPRGTPPCVEFSPTESAHLIESRRFSRLHYCVYIITLCIHAYYCNMQRACATPPTEWRCTYTRKIMIIFQPLFSDWFFTVQLLFLSQSVRLLYLRFIYCVYHWRIQIVQYVSGNTHLRRRWLVIIAVSRFWPRLIFFSNDKIAQDFWCSFWDNSVIYKSL